MKIGIVGARKYRDRQSVIDLVNRLPVEEVIITTSCKGVCTWAKEAAEKRDMTVKVYAPDLENIRSRFEVPERYYRRNKEMVEACDLLHAFISKEEGFAGGTKFEIEYAISRNISVMVHWESGNSQWIYQYSFPFIKQNQGLFISWQEFFRNTELQETAARKP